MADHLDAARRKRKGGVDPQDFAPGLLRIQSQPPAPFARSVLYWMLVLLCFLLLWSVFGRLDVVATAEGKLVPKTYVKIVQPFEQGLIRDILVGEGQHVQAGQLLMRLDATLSDADGNALNADISGKRIALRRIDAELADLDSFARKTDDPDDLYAAAWAQFKANRAAHRSALEGERSTHDKARSDLAAARQTRDKLVETLPHYREQAEAYADLAREGYVGRLAATDKKREHTEREQDLKTQEHIIASAQATLVSSERKLQQINADYHQKLRVERADTRDRLDKAQAEYNKQQYRHKLLELKATEDGVIKDLATHTIGTVISPGTILMTLVPERETLRAEVWVSNEDIGFIHPGESVKIKLAAYQFQKYGMLDGKVAHLSADATDPAQQSPGQSAPPGNKAAGAQPYVYRALIDIDAQELVTDNVRYALSPGMKVTAEIHLGTRTILEYLLSPVMGAFHEAARER